MIRDKIAQIIVDANLKDKTAGETADAIVAALPGMVEPLAWITPSPTTDGQWQDTTGMYDIEECILFIGHVETGIRFKTEAEAKAAANTHHRAAIMRALGL